MRERVPHCVAGNSGIRAASMPEKGLAEGSMKWPVRSAVCVLPLLLSGCFHRTHQIEIQPVAPPATNQSAEVKPAPVELPPSANTIPPEQIQNAKIPTEAMPHRPRHRKSEKNAEEAENTPPPLPVDATPAVSAIGQLSSGDPADVRQETEESIVSIEKGLKDINRPLSDPEQKTADQIREFLKQAQAALASGDVDGAHTLAVKAKVLLAELTH